MELWKNRHSIYLLYLSLPHDPLVDYVYVWSSDKHSQLSTQGSMPMLAQVKNVWAGIHMCLFLASL